jgi:hypothetical protein
MAAGAILGLRRTGTPDHVKTAPAVICRLLETPAHFTIKRWRFWVTP